MDYENLFAALKVDIPQALEPCPECGGAVLVQIGLSKRDNGDRPFQYWIFRHCEKCGFSENL